MIAFNSHSGSISELTQIVPVANDGRYEAIKDRQACLRHNTPILDPQKSGTYRHAYSGL